MYSLEESNYYVNFRSSGGDDLRPEGAIAFPEDDGEHMEEVMDIISRKGCPFSGIERKQENICTHM